MVNNCVALPRVLLLSMFLETVLLVIITAFPPVTVIATTAATTATATTTATTATSASTTATTTTTTTLVGLNFAVLYLFNLLVAVLLLALDEQIGALPLGLGLKSQKLLLLLLGGELDEHTALEAPVIATAQTDSVDRSISLEEFLNIVLGARLFASEALGVDAAGHGLVLPNLNTGLIDLGCDGLGKRNLALHCGVVVNQLNGLGGLQSLDNCGQGLESAHALEGVQKLEGHGIVGAAANLRQQELVQREVGVREVELNL
jgi:hypothetical protein